MSMDLSKYQKVKADEKFSVLRHANGSEFKIAHEGLSPEIASRIHKMPMFEAGGGVLGDAYSGNLGAAYQGIAKGLGGAGGSNAAGGDNAPVAVGPASGNVNLPKTAGIGENNPSAIYAPGLQQVASSAGVQGAQTGAIGAQGALQTQAEIAGGQSQNGVVNQQAAAQGLQGNAAQLQGIANGTGPNPAQAMLNQQTGANVSNQAALMAGQRGASANPALLARQAAQQGAATQQQAVGQGATLQSQQQLGAIGQLSGVNQALAGVGSGQVGQGVQATTAAAQGAQNEQAIQTGALNTQNQTLEGSQNNINTVNGVLNNTGLQGSQAVTGGLSGAAAPVASWFTSGARGGQIKAYEGGGDIPPDGNMVMQTSQLPQGSTYTGAPTPQAPPTAPGGPQSSFGKFLNNWASKVSDSSANPSSGSGSGQSNPGAQALQQGVSSLSSSLFSSLLPVATAAAAAGARGGKVKGLVSEGEVVIPPKDANNPAAAAGDVAQAKKDGGTIKANKPSEKAVKSGNSYANDKIEKDLPVGGIVIPRSVMQSKDPIRGAAEFVKAVMKKKGGK
jgi:hypothetical protein